jgi:hypothetical protein
MGFVQQAARLENSKSDAYSASGVCMVLPVVVLMPAAALHSSYTAGLWCVCRQKSPTASQDPTDNCRFFVDRDGEMIRIMCCDYGESPGPASQQQQQQQQRCWKQRWRFYQQQDTTCHGMHTCPVLCLLRTRRALQLPSDGRYQQMLMLTCYLVGVGVFSCRVQGWCWQAVPGQVWGSARQCICDGGLQQQRQLATNSSSSKQPACSPSVAASGRCNKMMQHQHVQAYAMGVDGTFMLHTYQ